MNSPLQIAGYDIFVGKNSFIDERLLHSPFYRKAMEERLLMMLESPDAAIYRQAKGLHFMRRGRILDIYRIYIRVHKNENSCVIAGLTARANIKRDETSGALDLHFLEILKQYENFGEMRVERLESLEEKESHEAEHEELFRYKSKNIHFTFQEESISEDRAEALLATLKSRRTSANRLIDFVLNKIEGHWSGRILADLISEGLAVDVLDLKNKRVEIAAYFHKTQLPWRVLYDALSEKLLIIPLEEIRFYASGMRGGHWLTKGV